MNKNKVMKRKSISLLLIITFIVTMAVPAFAYAEEKIIEPENIINQLNDLNFSKDVEFFIAPATQRSAMFEPDRELLKFDSVEEFEQFLQLLMIALSEDSIDSSSLVPLANDPEIDGKELLFEPFSTRRITAVESWWAPTVLPGLASITTFRHIQYSYNLNTVGARVTTATVDSSWITSANAAITWIHRFGSFPSGIGTPSFTDLNASVTGTWVLGFAIGPYPVGASWNDTWARTITVWH